MLTHWRDLISDLNEELFARRIVVSIHGPSLIEVEHSTAARAISDVVAVFRTPQGALNRACSLANVEIMYTNATTECLTRREEWSGEWTAEEHRADKLRVLLQVPKLDERNRCFSTLVAAAKEMFEPHCQPSKQ